MGPFFVLSMVSIHEWVCFWLLYSVLGLFSISEQKSYTFVLIEVEFIYNAVLVLSIQQSDSFIY